MAGITLAEAEAQKAVWLAALVAIGERGQTYTISDRRLDRADLKEVRETFDYWNRQVERLSVVATGRRGPRYAVPG